MIPIKKEQEVSEYSTFGRNEFTNVFTGETQKTVNVNWGPMEGIYFQDTEIKDDKELWDNYLSKLPELVYLADLTDEQFGDCHDLKEIYQGKERMCLLAKCASLPQETLEFLLKKYS